MTKKLPQLCVCVMLLSTILRTGRVSCLRRLTTRRLLAETDDIRSLLSSALESNPSQMTSKTNKRDTSSEDLASANSPAEDNVASESKDSLIYEDEVSEDDSDQQRDLDDSEYKRSAQSDSSANSIKERSADQADLDAYEDSDPREVKDVAKREAKNEYDYDDDLNAADSSESKTSEVEARATNARTAEDLEKNNHRRESNADEVNSDLNFEKQIEDQIQQRIDSIKEDIKREIERKQRVREIEANNAKYDELELRREVNEVDSDGVAKDRTSSVSRDSSVVNDVDDSGQTSVSRSKRSDLNEVVKIDEKKEPALALPVKKRNIERRVTLVEKADLTGSRRKDRSSLLIPERGHAEVKDELPGDLTLDSNLRLGRLDADGAVASVGSRSARSASRRDRATRRRRDMALEAENADRATREGNFLFDAREKSGCRARRSRRGGKARKRLGHSRRHRDVGEASVDDEELDMERDKGAMTLDEDAALESFGGFQSDASGALGRFKRIRRSAAPS